MFDYLNDLVYIGKYIVASIGILGLFLVVVGLIKDKRELVTRGGYLIILSVVLATCGYFIYNSTIDKANNMYINI